jgi:hypothetical protein
VGADRDTQVGFPHSGGAGEVLGGFAVLVVAISVDELFGLTEQVVRGVVMILVIFLVRVC